MTKIKHTCINYKTRTQ